jgi:signal transduction histidine kinase
MAILAVGWNLVLVQDYRQFMNLAHSLGRPGAATVQISTRPPWAPVVLGTLGFLVALVTMWGFFVRLLSEMKLNQLQSEFLHAVSHELKTPLASIELTSTLLREGTADAAETERLWASHDVELKRLKEEVETLLEAARWKSRPDRMSLSLTDLETWLDAGMVRWKQMLGPHASLSRAGDRMPGVARLDARGMNLITDNLIGNARKFSKGRPNVVIRTRWTQGFMGRHHWSVDFVDSGWGFEPKDADQIFDPFYRSRHAAPYAIPGNGLGLYLASSACKAMGLKLRGHSEGRNRGAVFTIEGFARRELTHETLKRIRDRSAA